ncbi:rhamnogalacturonan acetylesterase [Paenibacillus puerhi]|uniref:rhamnogalacturonan acetylesterase n=1 Tax=Paenibacillus puerhi TaxID=2692622 RepID=UPI00135AF982|nr:rhamnogalacturonan acetylesterase [Paenibacillus puerhi]
MKVKQRFSLVQGAAAEGSFALSASLAYEPQRGYGWAEAPAASRYEDLRDSWPGDYFIPRVPTLLIDVPNGNYVVKLELGSEHTASRTTVKAGLGKLMLREVGTEPGQTAQAEFAVHVDDGQLRLAFSDQAAGLRFLEIERRAELPTLYLAGDSTVTDQPSGGYPYTGWGQMLGLYLDAGIAVANHARSGRSTKSFITEDRLNRIWKKIRPGDCLLVQFAHNDEKDNEGGTLPFTTYQEYLSVYIDGARERGAYPVLSAPMHRRFFDEEGRIKNTHGEYIAAMEQLARVKQVPYIDLAARSQVLYEQAGVEGSKRLFMWTEPGQYEGLPEGTQDNTHFSEQGAAAIARLVAESIRGAGIEPLSKHIRPMLDML